MSNQSFNLSAFSEKLLVSTGTNCDAVISRWRDNCILIIEMIAVELNRLQEASMKCNQESCDQLPQLSRLKQMILSLAVPPDTIRQPEEFRKAWTEALTLVNKLPPEISLQLSKDAFGYSTDDSFFKKLQKRYAKYWYAAKQKNQRKSKTGQGQEFEDIYLRNIDIDSYVRVFMLLPVQQDMLNIWNSYNRLLSGIVHSLQEPFIKISLLAFNSDINRFTTKDQSEHLTQTVTGLKTRAEEWFAQTIEEFHQKVNLRFEKAQENLNIAATPLLPVSEFDKNELNSLRSAYGKSFGKYRRAWIEHWKGEKEDWEKQIDITRLCRQASLLIEDFVGTLNKVFNERILTRLDLIKQKIKNQLDEYNKGVYQDSHAIMKKITGLQQRLEQEVISSYIPETIDSFLDIRIDDSKNNYATGIINEIELLKDEYSIFKEEDSFQLIPDSVLDSVPLKSIVRIDVEKLVNNLDTFQAEINESLLSTSNDLSYIGEIVTYMEDTVQEMVEHSTNQDFRELSDSVHHTVNEGFEQAIEQTGVIEQKIRNMLNVLAVSAFSHTSDFLESTVELRDNKRLIQINFEYVHAKAKKRVKTLWADTEQDISRHSFRVLRIVAKRLSKLYDLLTQRYRKLSEITRLGTANKESAREISEYLKHTRDKITALPTVYRRLFRFEALTNDKLYITREIEKEQIEKSFTAWKKGGTGLVALVGERGSGRTTFINHLRREMFSHSRIYEINSENNIYTESDLLQFLKNSLHNTSASTLEELEQMIIEDENRSVCVFENIQVLFLKTISGLEIIKRFVLFAMRTDSKLFWVVSSSYYTWQFLDKVIRISSLFGNVVYLKGMNSGELTDLILKRHRISGLSILFAPGEALKKSKKYRKIKSIDKKQEWLREKFFEQLEDLSSGNVSAAILYWQNNIKLSENKKMIATISDKVDMNFLQNLPDVDLFAITILIQHEVINIKDFAEVLNLTMDEARIILTSLVNRGIVVENKNGFELHFFLYRPMTRILYEKRLLH